MDGFIPWIRAFLLAKAVFFGVREAMQKPETRDDLALLARGAARLAGKGLRFAAERLREICRQIGREGGQGPA